MTAYAPEAPPGAAPRQTGAAAGTGRPARIAMTRPEAPDTVLVARCLGEDDRHAFAELIRRHQSAVRSLLRRLTRGNDALADDLAQDTFVQVWRNLRQFRGDAKFSTWIYRIAYNAFLAHARAAHHEAALPEQLPEDETGRSLAVESAMRMDLAKALARLSEAERAAIIHCYYQDLSHE